MDKTDRPLDNAAEAGLTIVTAHVLPCAVGGFDKSRVMSNGEVHALLQRLPETHYRGSVLNSLKYVDVVNEVKTVKRSSRAYFPPEYIFGECQINLETGAANATIYRQHAKGNIDPFHFRHAIMHEVGHAVYEKLVTLDDKAEFYRISAHAPVIYNEQSREPVEHFAHLYADYVIRPLPIKSHFSEFYEFLREGIFGGTEY